MMVESHEAVVDYMTPLGLHHLFGVAIITGRRPGGTPRSAMIGIRSITIAPNADGIGFDRTATGSGTPSASIITPERFANISNCPEKFLLWFHHVPWDRPSEIKTNSLGRAGAALPARRGLGKSDA